MARASKRTKRAMRRAAAYFGEVAAAVTPAAFRDRLAPVVRYCDMLFLDHLVVRLFFPNRHKISDTVWRGAQPLPHHVRGLARQGIRTIVNLRGKLHSPTYELLKRACERHGITLVDFRLRSRDAPSREELLGARELFERIEYPMLMHCKSGADRAGLMSALYRHLKDGVPIAEARHELALKYGHIRQADTGVLDYFFERYLADTKQRPMPFYEWVETVYDPQELKRSFRAKGWANRLVNDILRRE
ncbi:MAG TPA: protein tyrosine phosphatase [Hyphomicrobiaceae bacterium]|nr:protein tyrosine phosphatase [Hyphomicrobiaceae bacterium]